MPKTISTNWLLFLVLIGSLAVAACGGGGAPEEVTFDLQIDRALMGSQSALEVKQDDVVTFNVTSDEAASFHLHGYDHELELAPQQTGIMSFTADATGSFPITIHVGTESGGEEHDGVSSGDDHHEKTIEAPADLSVAVEATLDAVSGVNLKITTTGFTFAPEHASGEHVPGEGHAHVYVDGVKDNRVYGDYYHLSGLDPGERSIRITLNANSHEQYAKGEHPVEATTTIVVPGEAADASDHHDDESSASEPTEIDLGRLVVLPR